METIASTEQICSLCGLELLQNPILEGMHSFCCPGCHAVFNILSSKNQLQNYPGHPLFQQAVRSGLISNPILLENLRSKTVQSSEKWETLHLEILEMWCPSCAEIIKLILLQERGIKNCLVDYATDLAAIEFSPLHISKERILEIIQSLGYRPAYLLDSTHRAVSFNLYMRFIVAAFFSLNIMMFAYPLYASYFDYDDQGGGSLFAWISCFASLPVLTYSAWPILKRAGLSLKVGLPGMELLVAIGVLAAFGLSLYDLLNGGNRVYFDSMTVIVAFVLLGKIIEAKAKFSAKDTLLRLTRAMPRRGRKRMADGQSCFVPIKDIQPGDTVIAFAGEKIVLDGRIIEGEGTCDESLMTGESTPIFKSIGDSVLGGTLVCKGWIVFCVTATMEESALQRIIQMVEQDLGHKTPYVRAADQIVRWFVPLIVSIGLIAALAVWFFHLADPGRTVGESAIIRFVSVLLISCPCAIGIAVPLVEAHLMNGLAKLGALVRNRGCLPLLGKETIFVFDKTGTITEGHFQVLHGLEKLTSRELAILKAIVSCSNHPIANAIARAITTDPYPIVKTEEITGQGMRGQTDETIYFLGSPQFLRQQGIEIDDSVQGFVSSVYFACNKEVLTCLALGDCIKKQAPELISKLSCRTVLLSGDSRSAVEAVSKTCGFSECQWAHTPLLKREFVEKLKKEGKIVCMVGDGINDAPALTLAQVGMSVVSATDVSIQVSDILLTTDRLDVIPKIRALAQRGRRILAQNLFWAFFYNGVGVGLAACGTLSPIFAAFAMVASSLMVIFNAQRVSLSQRR